MATYVTSDAHGHLRALNQALELAQPGSDDTLYVLGDMVDRGPDPAGTLKLVRSLDNARVLMGNHERMLLDALLGGSDMDELTWHMNGGYATAEGLDALPADEARDMIDWIANLPLFAVLDVSDLRPSAAPTARRPYILCHAGIDALALRGYLATTGYVDADDDDGYADIPLDVLHDAVAAQSADDLLWIRSEFWSEPTGLVGQDGSGPVVIAGHTPSILLSHFATLMSGTGMDADGMGTVVEVGASHATGGVADRVDIDCSAAAGWPQGRVGIMRLEDRHMWYANINEGE